MSKALGELAVKDCKPEEFKGVVDIVFSGLDSDVAGETGMLFNMHPKAVRDVTC